jgi:hypothetical protein
MSLFVKKTKLRVIIIYLFIGLSSTSMLGCKLRFSYLNFIKLSAINKDKQSNFINQGRDKTML